MKVRNETVEMAAITGTRRGGAQGRGPEAY